MDYRLAVLGAGPGGYLAALQAARLGAGVCLIEREEVGGTCLNRGCIPTKALLNTAETAARIREAAKHGIRAEITGIDFAEAVKRKKRVVSRLVKGVRFLLKKAGVDLYSGHGRLLSNREIEIDGDGGTEYITAEGIIIATGSRPLLPPVFGYDGRQVCSSREALDWRELPRRLAVIGGGIIGCEFAELFAGLGVEVTVIELLPRLMSNLPEEFSTLIARTLKDRGVRVMTGTEVAGVNKSPDGVEIELVDSESDPVSCDRVLVSIGREACTEDIGCEYVGLKLDDADKIVVDHRMATSTPGIYAIGDVSDSPYDLAHSAYREGMVAAKNALGGDVEMEYGAIPACVYTSPELASVGLSVEAAREAGYTPATGRFDFAANGKALAVDRAHGFVQLVADDDSGRLLGAHIAGPRATELIAEAGTAVANGHTVESLVRAVHAHPTLSEAVWEAAEGVFGDPLHM